MQTVKQHILSTLTIPPLEHFGEEAEELAAVGLDIADLEGITGNWTPVDQDLYDPLAADELPDFDYVIRSSSATIRQLDDKLVIVGNDGRHAVYWLFYREAGKFVFPTSSEGATE